MRTAGRRLRIRESCPALGGAPGPGLGKRSFSGAGTTLLSQAQMSTFLCFDYLRDLRNAAVRAEVQDRTNAWLQMQGLSPHGVQPFVLPFCIPLLARALPSLRTDSRAIFTSRPLISTWASKEHISGQQDRRRRRKVKQDSQSEVGKRAAEAVQNYPHNKYVLTYVCAYVRGAETRVRA